MPSDTCARCAAVWRASLERAAGEMCADCANSEPFAWRFREGARVGVHPLRYRDCAAESIRALTDTPPPCDCAARDRVVEAAVFRQCERSTVRRLDVGPAGTWLAQGIVDAMRRAVAALEGAEHE